MEEEGSPRGLEGLVQRPQKEPPSPGQRLIVSNLRLGKRLFEGREGLLRRARPTGGWIVKSIKEEGGDGDIVLLIYLRKNYKRIA